MLCDFDANGQCKNCTRKVAKLPHYAPCPKPVKPIPFDCQHIGKETNRQTCAPCGGTRIKIFQCTIHGQCQVENKLEDIKACENCENRLTVKLAI